MGQGIYAIYGDRGLVGYCRLYAVSLTGRKGQKHVCLHSTNCTIAHAVTQYPPFFGVVKTVSIPFGQYPRNWGVRGHEGSGSNRGNRVGVGYFRGFFALKIIFFWGGYFSGFFALTCGKNVLKIKNLWERMYQPLPPTPSPQCAHVLVRVYEIVDQVVIHMIVILG